MVIYIYLGLLIIGLVHIHHHRYVHLLALDHVLGGGSEVAQACVAKLPVTCVVIS